MPKAFLLRSSSRSSKRSAARRKSQGPKHVASQTAVAAVTICRKSWSRSFRRARLAYARYLVCRAIIRAPFVFNCFPLLDFAGTSVDAVTINSRTRVGIAAAFGVVDLTKNEFKIGFCRLFGAVRDAIQ